MIISPPTLPHSNRIGINNPIRDPGNGANRPGAWPTLSRSADVTKRTCDVPGCDRKHKGHGLCDTHLYRQKHGLPLAAELMRQSRKGLTCEASDCLRPVAAAGLCSLHWQRRQNGVPMDALLQRPNAGLECSIDECEKPARKRGWCPMHYARWRAHGDTSVVIRAEHLPCSVQSCERPGMTVGMCEFHRRRLREGTALEQALKPRGAVCSIRGCSTLAQYRGLCRKHRQRQDYIDDPSPFKAKSARRRYQAARGMTGLDKDISTAYRAAIDGDPCAYCGGRTTEMHVDHQFPLSKGGTDHWWNLAMACSHCNLTKHARCATRFRLLVGLKC